MISRRSLRPCLLVLCCSFSLSVGTLLGSAPQARAERAAVLKVSANTAQGTTQTGIQRLTLGVHGLNLSFLALNESIQKVWLDDPTRVVIDFDGCLVGALGGGGGGSSSSSCGGASIIRLRQLPQPIAFPKGLFAEQSTTQLTVITVSGSTRKLYQFQLVLAGGTPPYSMVEIIPSPAPAPAQLVSVSQEYQQTVLRQLSKGLAIAESKQMLDRQSAAYQQAVATIALMQGGKPFAEATKQTGVPNALVDRLRALGSVP
ncbi:MAG: hypothetical protein RBJ76_01010 [Stenomitos frigidus ULC029]